MDTKRKEQINKLVDLYLDDLQSLAADAGWHQESMLSRAADFNGQIPPPTGNDKSNAKMVYEITFLRNPHARLPEAKALVAALFRKSTPMALALLAKRYYTHTYLHPKLLRVMVFDDHERARRIGQKLRTFERNAQAAYNEADEILTILEIRREIAGRAA